MERTPEHEANRKAAAAANPRGPSFDGYRPKITAAAGIDLRCRSTTSKGTQCKRRVEPGWEVCKQHREWFEQHKPSGPKSHLYSTGRYAKLLPPKLQERYDHAQGDPELLVLEQEIRLVDARLQDMAARLDQGESGALWQKAKQSIREVAAAYRRRAYGEATPLMLDLKETVEAGVAEQEAWAELGRWIDRRKQLVESERKRLVELQQYVPAQRVQVMLQAIGGIIQTHVTDPSTLAAIATGIGRVVDAGPRHPVEPGGRAALTVDAREAD